MGVRRNWHLYRMNNSNISVVLFVSEGWGGAGSVGLWVCELWIAGRVRNNITCKFIARLPSDCSNRSFFFFCTMAGVGWMDQFICEGFFFHEIWFFYLMEYFPYFSFIHVFLEFKRIFCDEIFRNWLKYKIVNPLFTILFFNELLFVLTSTLIFRTIAWRFVKWFLLFSSRK